MKKSAPSPRAKSKASQNFPVVGVGASAGGLEAFTQLLHHLPATTGMSFVLVQHLDPVHESELTSLLSRATPMPTQEATNNLRLRPNQIYVIPRNTNLSVANGVLTLEPRPEGRAPHRSIDHFFAALAHDQQERAIGVILSGTGTDGTLGLEAIKSEGGITLAQDHSAKYDSMPRSAVAAGCADFVLSPEEIANELVRIAAHPYVVAKAMERKPSSGERERESAVSHQEDSAPLPSGGHGTPEVGAVRAHAEAYDGAARLESDDFRQILTILRVHCGVDFSLYKSSTIQRRIARRMILSKRATLSDYATFLRDNKAELDTLFSDVLISVTSFFRNPDAFEVLKDTVFPDLLEHWTGNDPVRVWVLGCSTGQEAYSIAMAFAEFSDDMQRAVRLQVFATDLNDALLDKARQGLYAKTLAQDLSPERLRRFFIEEQGGYRVIKALREQIVFARQNLISDPPFSRMDLISCRNLLIYLEPGLQRKIIPSFHYALRPGGFLFLGASESVGQFTDLFEVADKKQKIFRKKAAPVQPFQLPMAGDRGAYPPRERVAQKMHVEDSGHAELTAQREADRFVLTQFVPSGVLVNNELQVLQFRGSTSPYLAPPTGRATFDLLKMARRELIVPLRNAINKARKDNAIVRKENVHVAGDPGMTRVTIQVVPLKNLREACFLILFEPLGAGATSRQRDPPLLPAKPLSAREESRRIDELERELAELRDYHQAVQEQSEAANEELQASNEEVQSANEELQSTNEELETSKEELESTNEELTTINEEMSSRNAELHRLNADLANLQSSISTAVVLLGRDLTIRRFTAPAEKIFSLLATDIGRPFSAIRHHLTTTPLLPSAPTGSPPGPVAHAAFPLESVISEVIDRVLERQGEVQDRDGRWYVLRIRPYMSLDKKIDGAVLTLTDIDALKRSEQEAKEALEYVQAILRTTRSPLLVVDGELIVKTVNPAFSSVFKLNAADVEGRSLLELSDGAWTNPQLRRLLEDIVPRDGALTDFEVTHDFPAVGVRTMLLNAQRLQRDRKAQPLILLSMEDITERKNAERVLHDADHHKDEFLATLAHELRNPLAPISNAAQILNMTPGGSPAVRAAAQVMLRQTDHIVRLIDDLLDASRVSRGRIELRRGRVDVLAIVKQTVDAARSVEKDAREFTLSLPPEALFVNADPVRLTQIVGNLLSNAVKFTQRNGHIGVSVDGQGEDVCIRVRDDGIGMAADQIPRVFEMFTQLDTSLERSTSGLGIGLALARQLTELHGGSLDARSGGKNRGSEFIVRLPLLKDAVYQPVRQPSSIDAPSMSGRRILIVDDNHDAAVTLATLLQMAGNTTHIANDGIEAIEAVEAFKPDVAFFDIGMPRLNGYDAARCVREKPWGKDVVLIALTGLGAEHDRQKSLEAGFDGHLVKPSDFAAIAAAVAGPHEQRSAGG